jgi:sugar (pentulose or hexulose) kinase
MGAVISRLLEGASIHGDEVGVLALACQVDGVVPIIGRGDPLGPAIIWLDRRADVEAERLATSSARSALRDHGSGARRVALGAKNYVVARERTRVDRRRRRPFRRAPAISCTSSPTSW